MCLVEVKWATHTWRKIVASKHCRCVQVTGLMGVAIIILPSGQMRDTRNSVVAMSSSSWSFSFTVMKKTQNSRLKPKWILDFLRQRFVKLPRTVTESVDQVEGLGRQI